MARRRRGGLSHPLGILSTLVVASSLNVVAAADAVNATSTILGHDRDWWLDRGLLSEGFRFDGTQSDFAQQFLHLFLDSTAAPLDAVAGGELEPAQRDAVDDRIQKAIAASSDNLVPRVATFATLSPFLQRAVLWDLGIVKAGDVAYTQVWTKCGLRMNEVAVTFDAYNNTARCTAQTCSTTKGELFYQSLQCNGFQIGNVSRCAAASGKSPVHAAMWSTGGDEWTVPDSIVGKHEWTDANISYVVYGIHLADDPNSYGKCVAPSMTIPCIAYERLSQSDQASWCVPAPSRLVTQWIRAENEVAVAHEASTKKTPPLEIVLSSIVAVCVLLIGVWWIIKRRRERMRGLRNQKTGNETAESDEDNGVSYFFTEENDRWNKRRGMGRDPQSTAVLGGGLEKARSLGHDTSTGHERRLRDENASFVPMLRDSADLTHSVAILGCGAVLAGSSVYGDSNCRFSRDRKTSSATYPLHNDVSPVCNSNTSTDLSSNGDITGESFGWSPMPLSAGAEPAQTPYSSSVSSSSSARTNTSESKDSVSVLGELLKDPRVMAKRVAYVDVSVSRQLSKGAFGEVWVGRMRDKLVAVKRLVPERRKHLKDLNTFVAEIRLMAQFEHRNVMSLLGVAWNSPPNLCMMMEFLDNGDLQDLLKAHSPNELTWQSTGTVNMPQDDEAVVDPSGKKTSIAIDVASALRYLHGMTPPIVHRDLKSHNILLTLDLVAKLCDFGVSRVNEGIDTMTCGVGTAFWTAPEVLVGDKYTETADVYSFGVVLTELDTHHVPFYDAVDDETGARLEPMRIMHRVCMGELVPTVTPECPSVIRELARDCMQLEPSHRPTPDDIIGRLRKFRREEEDAVCEQPALQTTGTPASNDPSSQWRTRVSSAFSVSDDGRSTNSINDTGVSGRRVLNSTIDSTSSSLDDIQSPRDSDVSDSGAVWI